MPDGTQGDPYIVYYWSDLVEKAAEEGVYIKIGLDINIMGEYPDGDMPSLEINKSIIDGDYHIISNLYKTSGDYLIKYTNSGDAAGYMHDLTFRNIYIDGLNAMFFKRDSNTRYIFENCNFSGISFVPFMDNGNPSCRTLRFKKCSFNVDLKSNKASDYHGMYFDNCYVKLRSTYSGSNSFFDKENLPYVGKDSYFELDLPNLATSIVSNSGGFDNSVLDITSNQAFTVGGGSGAVSIINSTHAPNAVPDGTNVKPVSNTNWLDESYLNGIGFNIGVIE